MSMNRKHAHPVTGNSMAEGRANRVRKAQTIIFRLKDNWLGSCELDWTNGFGKQVASGFDGHGRESVTIYPDGCYAGMPMPIAYKSFKGEEAKLLIECYSTVRGGLA